MNCLRFELRQHPVGQGGFHTGWLIEGDDPRSFDSLDGDQAFRWIYDCGSNQLDSLRREIRKFRGAEFDILFLSHLDSDHVVGVDTLLQTATAKEVVLPYLGDVDWALHLSAGLYDGTLSGSFVDLANDPAAWFGSRGVERLTFVEPDDDDDGGRPTGLDPVVPRDPDKRERGERIKVKWGGGRSIVPGVNQSDANTYIISNDGGNLISPGQQTLNWVLSPYAFRPSASQMDGFKKKLEEKFGASLSAKDYADHARSKAGRKDLRECYDPVALNHNLNSMALYSGPLKQTSSPIRNTSWYGQFIKRTVQPGWISTGDFNTAVKKRRNKLFQHYARYYQMVGHLSLPHHGSDASFDVGLLHAYPHLRAAVAATGPNSYGHPGCKVQTAVTSMPALSFVRVDENPATEFIVYGLIE